jgi:outer membrane protein assembly factor BamB
VITIVNGDLNHRVGGAHVRLWRRTAKTNRRGVAEIVVPRRRKLTVTVTARGFLKRVTVQPFRHKRKATIRIYRPELQWPMYGVDEQRTQAHASIRLRPPFRTVWSHSLGSLVEFPPVVWEGVAYVANLNGQLYALSMRNGKTIWRFDLHSREQDSSPAVVGDDLVMHSKSGRVWVLNRFTGRARWSYPVDGRIESSPVVRDGIDYFGTWAGTVYALDLRRHRVLWRYHGGYKITSSAALLRGTLFIGDYGGRLLALSLRSGQLRHSVSVNGRVYGTPAIAAGRVFVPSSDGNSLTGFTTGGRHLWTIHTGSYVYSSPAVWRGRVFFGAYNGVFYCVSAASGRILWTVGTGGRVSGAPVVVDGIAYVASFAHRIYGVNARTGRVVFFFRHGEYVPVSGNGGRLLLNGYHEVYAVVPRRHRRRR